MGADLSGRRPRRDSGRRLLGGILFLVLGFPVFALALSLGPFEITPELTLEERYESNIFLEPSDERSDFISYGAFNLKVALPIRLTRARRIIPFVAYFADAAAFAENTAENFQNQGVTGGLDLDLPLTRPDERFAFNVSNSFRSVTELSSSAEQSDIGPRTRRDENFLAADMGYFLTRRDEIHLFYNRLDLDQKDIAEFLDRNENTIGLTYFRRLRPWLSGLIEYNFKLVDFTNLRPGDPDFSSSGHIIALGFRGDPTARLSGTFKLGAEFRDFEHQRDSSGLFAAANLGYRITPRLLSTLLLSREIEESTNQEFSSFEANFVKLRFTHQFTAKISAFVEGAFELDEFKDRISPGEPARRFDRLYELGAGGDYQFARWLAVGLSYLYRTKDSNEAALDYVDNRVILRFRVRF